MKKKNEISIVRSSAAENFTFLTATGQSDVNAIYADDNAVTRIFRVTANDGKIYDTKHYNLILEMDTSKGGDRNE